MNEPKKILNDIAKYLQSIDFTLSKAQNDGRINSTLNESEVLRLIEKKFDISVPQSRNWADFFIDTIPVNIKITTTKTADNASSKKGLYYALTGEIYTGKDPWENYLKQLKNNIKDTDKDYYFLVINKENTNDIFVNSLKQITTLQPNGNNPPFQIKWCDNKNPKNQNWNDSKSYLLKTLGETLKLRADAFVSFQKYFNNYL